MPAFPENENRLMPTVHTALNPAFDFAFAKFSPGVQLNQLQKNLLSFEN